MAAKPARKKGEKNNDKSSMVIEEKQQKNQVLNHGKHIMPTTWTVVNVNGCRRLRSNAMDVSPPS